MCTRSWAFLLAVCLSILKVANGGRGIGARNAGSATASSIGQGATVTPAAPITLQELDSSTFDNAITAFTQVVVLFYAPWCGHSFQLQKELEQAAATLSGRAAFFRIDASTHVSIAERYRTDQTPVLVLFQPGGQTEAEEYVGTRSSAEIAKWIEKQSLLSVYEVESEAKLEEVLATALGLPYYVARGSLQFQQKFEKVASYNRHMGSFVYVKSSVNEEASLTVVRGFAEKIEMGATDPTEEDILEWCWQEQLPLFWAINDDNYEAYMQRATEGMLWVVFNPDVFVDNATALKSVFEDVARDFAQFPFVFIDASVYHQHVREELGCDSFPEAVLQLGDLSNETQPLTNYRLPLPDDARMVTQGLMKAWINAVIAGKVYPEGFAA